MANLTINGQVAIFTAGPSTTLPPASYGPFSWIPFDDFNRIMSVTLPSNFGVGATFDFKYLQATDSSGSNMKDIPGKAFTQLTSNPGNLPGILELGHSDLDIANGFTHVAVQWTVGVANVDFALLTLAGGVVYGPASQLNTATYETIPG